MNMFYLDSDPVKCAEYHYDTHVRKMILESAQLLSTAHRIVDGTEIIKLDKAGRRRRTWILEGEMEEVLYKSTHFNHPVAKWLRESVANYEYLHDLYIQLGEEYEYRFGKKHKSMGLALWLSVPPENIPNKPFTTPAIATDDENKFIDNPIRSYRRYYATTKYSLYGYTKREAPDWLIEYREVIE